MLCGKHFDRFMCLLHLSKRGKISRRTSSVFGIFQTVFDVGSPGLNSDGGVLAHATFGQVMEQGKMNFPPPHKHTRDSNNAAACDHRRCGVSNA